MSVKRRGLESNIWKYYVFNFLQLFVFFGAIITVYFLDLGLSLLQISLISSVGWIVSLLFEVPSGIVSDFYGKKKTLIISSFAFFLWVLFLGISKHYIFILLAGFFGGIKLSFTSGSDSALLYDTLKDLKREDEHPKITGRVSSLFLIGTGISAIIGSTIAAYTSIRVTIFLTLFVAFLSILVAFSFAEPKMNKRDPSRKYFSHLKESFNICKQNKKLYWLILLLSSINTLFATLFIYFQVFLVEHPIDISLYGWIYFVLLSVAAFSSYHYGWVHKKFSDIRLLKIMSYVCALSVIGIFFAKSFLLFIFLFVILELIFGLFRPTSQHYINVEIASKYRATILSLVGFLAAVLKGLFQPISGFIGDIIGIYSLFAVLGGVFLVVSLICLHKLTSHY